MSQGVVDWSHRERMVHEAQLTNGEDIVLQASESGMNTSLHTLEYEVTCCIQQ